MEREVLGNKYAKTIIQAGYSHFRTGFYKAPDSRLVFLDVHKEVIDTGNYHFEGRVLLTNFTGKDNKNWKISWQKEE